MCSFIMVIWDGVKASSWMISIKMISWDNLQYNSVENYNSLYLSQKFDLKCWSQEIRFGGLCIYPIYLTLSGEHSVYVVDVGSNVIIPCTIFMTSEFYPCDQRPILKAGILIQRQLRQHWCHCTELDSKQGIRHTRDFNSYQLALQGEF